MKNNIQKISRKQRRAESEIDVVKLCRDNLSDKKATAERLLDEKSKQIDLLLERGKLCSDNKMKVNIAREIKTAKESLKIKERDYHVFQDFVFLFDRLLDRLDSLYNNGRYKYIIKIIPEKRLPAMVLNPDKVEKLTDLLNTLIAECNGAILKYQIAFNKSNEDVYEAEGIQSELDKEYNKLDKDIEDILALLDDNKVDQDSASLNSRSNVNRN